MSVFNITLCTGNTQGEVKNVAKLRRSTEPHIWNKEEPDWFIPVASDMYIMCLIDRNDVYMHHDVNRLSRF